MSAPRGRFIVFEGGEASGKSTQARLLAERTGSVLTREPGGTPLGAQLRAVLLDPQQVIAPRAEALLMAADRAQHVDQVIAPALAAGHDVVCDRFIGSSLAYQGYGRGLGVDEVAALSAFAVDGVRPDLVVLLEVSEAEADRRLDRRPEDVDRLEAEGRSFHERVAHGYRELAAADPSWIIVDGSGSIETVASRVELAVRRRLLDGG